MKFQVEMVSESLMFVETVVVNKKSEKYQKNERTKSPFIQKEGYITHIVEIMKK